MARLAGLIVLLAMIGFGAVAEASERVALVFGAGKYRNIRELKNPANDAEAVRKALVELRFDVTIETDRDLRRMRRALDYFAEDAAGAEVALVFFAGHGVEIAGDNRLLPVDADASSLQALKATSLPVNAVRDALAGTAKSLLIVLDACRDDPFGAGAGEGRSAKALGADVRARAKPGLGRIGRAENTLIAFAAAPGATASDGTSGNSPFSAALARYLATGGLEIGSVFDLVQQEVYERSSGGQLPFIEDGLPRFFFAGESGDLPERERLLLAMAALTPDLRNEVERIAADRQMPLGPLYGALIGADLKTAALEDRERKLAEAADAFVRTRDDLRRLASDDPQVTKLRAEAEEKLALGAFGEARARLKQAAGIDATSAERLAANLVRRRLSEAATHQADGGVARAQLDRAGAIAAWEKAAALHEAVEREDVTDADRRVRNWLLADLGNAARESGDIALALDAYNRMERAARLRLEKSPDLADAERDVSVSLNRVGDVLRAQGDLAAALARYEESLEIARRLAAADPGHAERARDVSVSLNRIGDVLRAQGDLAGALARYKEGLEIRRRPDAADPRQAERARDVSVSLERIGNVLEAQGDLAGAQAQYEVSLAIARRLAATDPSHAERARDVSVSLNRIGDVLTAQGDFAGALARYEEGLAISRRLAAADPSHAERARDVSVSLDKIGDVLEAKGDLAGALAQFEDGLAIARRLAATDTGHAERARDVSASLNRIGDLLLAGNDLGGALERYEESLEIARRLAAADPSHVERARDVFVGLAGIGIVHRRTGAIAPACAAYNEARAIIAPLAQAAPDNYQRQQDLAWIEAQIGNNGCGG